ncbi:MAG: cytidine deaminase [Lachnospiraceae bacterium]|nr:cytidine deaminase [Lachnospiraceae bacterium]
MQHRYRELITKALNAREAAYAPYSSYKVGAALLSKDDKIFTGCNVENASYGATNCAERTAIFKAVSEGSTQFVAIAIVGGKAGEVSYAAPCGICRQVMMEFCNPKEFHVIIAKSCEDYKVYTLEELLPVGFGAGNVK